MVRSIQRSTARHRRSPTFLNVLSSFIYETGGNDTSGQNRRPISPASAASPTLPTAPKRSETRLTSCVRNFFRPQTTRDHPFPSFYSLSFLSSLFSPAFPILSPVYSASFHRFIISLRPFISFYFDSLFYFPPNSIPLSYFDSDFSILRQFYFHPISTSSFYSLRNLIFRFSLYLGSISY